MPELKSYELEKKLWTSPASIWSYPALLLVGEEHYLKEELLEVVTKKLNINKYDGYVKLDAETLKGDELIIALETSSFDDFKQLVIIENADKIKPDMCKKLYEMWDKGGFPESSLPIFIAETVDARRSLWKLVKEEGSWAKFWKMFEDKLVSWTVQRFQLEKVKAARQSAEELVALCGNDLRKIAREIQRLALVYDSTVVTPEIVRKMVPKATEVSKFDIEDRFMMREIPALLLLLEELGDKADIRGVVLSLIRYCRHALQARFYIEKREAFAIQLAELGQQIYKFSIVKDWNNISNRNNILKLATDIISKVPATEKMLWTGNRPLFEEAKEEEEDKAEVTADVDSEKTPAPKGKKKKAINFDVDAERKKDEAQEEKKKQQSEAYEIYCHNLWAQKNSLPICKAFAVAAKYREAELLSLLKELSRAYYSIWTGEENLLHFKLNTILLDIIVKTKGDN